MTSLCPLTSESGQEKSFVGLGGEVLYAEKHKAACLRADLCELAAGVSFNHGPRIVDLILAKYDVRRRF